MANLDGGSVLAEVSSLQGDDVPSIIDNTNNNNGVVFFRKERGNKHTLWYTVLGDSAFGIGIVEDHRPTGSSRIDE